MTEFEKRGLPATGEVRPGEDILSGADEIAEYMFGDKKHRRKVYHLHDKGYLPTFKLGMVVCARKSTLLRWIEDQERARQAS